MRIRLFATLVLATAACSASRDEPQPQPPEPVHFERQAMVAFHMRRHFDDLRVVERLLVAGSLDDAKARAFLLTRPAPDPGIARWQREVDDVSEAAAALTTAPGIDEGCRREARVAEACAWCHLHTQTAPLFARRPSLPADDGSALVRMVRHQWAADRLWEGLVGPADGSWRAGVDVLVTTPLPFSPLTDAPQLASQLQMLAQRAIDSRTSETLDDRARTYGEMLVTCSACHSTLHAPH